MRTCKQAMNAAARMARKPNTRSGRMLNVVRYVTDSTPTKKAKMPTSKPGK